MLQKASYDANGKRVGGVYATSNQEQDMLCRRDGNGNGRCIATLVSRVSRSRVGVHLLKINVNLTSPKISHRFHFRIDANWCKLSFAFMLTCGSEFANAQVITIFGEFCFRVHFCDSEGTIGDENIT